MLSAITALSSPTPIPPPPLRPVRPLRATSTSSFSADLEALAAILPRINGAARASSPDPDPDPESRFDTPHSEDHRADPPPPVLRLAPEPGPAPPSAEKAKAPTPKPDEPPPDPSALCCSIVQATVEVLRGVRPLAQLTRWVTPEVYEALARRRHVVAQSEGVSTMQARIRRARVLRVSPVAAEASVVVQDADRVRAAAIRVEFLRGNWRVVALELG